MGAGQCPDEPLTQGVQRVGLRRVGEMTWYDSGSIPDGDPGRLPA